MFYKLKDGESNYLHLLIPVQESCFSWWSCSPRVVFNHQGSRPMFSSSLFRNVFEDWKCILPFLSSYFLAWAARPSFSCSPRSFRLSLLSFVQALSSFLLFTAFQSTLVDWAANQFCSCRGKSSQSVIHKQQQSLSFSQDLQYLQLPLEPPQWFVLFQNHPHSWTSPFLNNVGSPI